MNWFYLFSGAIALYSVETADADQPFHITALVAFLLCLIPASVEALVPLRRKDANVEPED